MWQTALSVLKPRDPKQTAYVQRMLLDLKRDVLSWLTLSWAVRIGVLLSLINIPFSAYWLRMLINTPGLMTQLMAFIGAFYYLITAFTPIAAGWSAALVAYRFTHADDYQMVRLTTLHPEDRLWAFYHVALYRIRLFVLLFLAALMPVIVTLAIVEIALAGLISGIPPVAGSYINDVIRGMWDRLILWAIVGLLSVMMLPAGVLFGVSAKSFGFAIASVITTTVVALVIAFWLAQGTAPASWLLVIALILLIFVILSMSALKRV